MILMWFLCVHKIVFSQTMVHVQYIGTVEIHLIPTEIFLLVIYELSHVSVWIIEFIYMNTPLYKQSEGWPHNSRLSVLDVSYKPYYLDIGYHYSW